MDITDITTEFQSLKERIESLQNQVNSLGQQVERFEQKFIELEKNQTLNLKHALSELYKRSQATKIDQDGDSILKSEHSPNLLSNQSEVKEPRHPISESLLKASQSPFKTSEQSEQYNIPSEQEKALNKPNFITSEDNRVVDVWQSPGSLSEQEKIEII